MTGVPDNRCGYCYPEDFDQSDNPDPDKQSSCYRKTWEDNDRCIWHTRDDNKDTGTLQAARSTQAERIDGAHLSGVHLSDLSFSDCSLRGARFDHSKLSSLKFNSCDLTDTSFKNASLFEVDLSGAMAERSCVAHC